MRNKLTLAMTGAIAAGLMLASALTAAGASTKEKKKDGPELSPLEQYIEQARRGSGPSGTPSPGSTWSPDARLYDIATDLRASRVNDIVTIIVKENASAVSQGSLSSERSSSANASVSALAGVPSPAGGLQNLLGLESDRKLEGKGETSRRTVLNATMAARVVEVLPNGNMVIEGEKNIAVNSEVQIIKLRGIVRPYDIGVANAVSSDQIAQMELKVNGKGVVNDSIRRPNILYRILLGILPF